MIKFTGDGPDGPILGFGLTAGNLAKLRAGYPILVDLQKDMKVTETPRKILIFFGTTEADIYALFKGAGAVDENTQIIGVPRDSDHLEEPSS